MFSEINFFFLSKYNKYIYTTIHDDLILECFADKSFVQPGPVIFDCQGNSKIKNIIPKIFYGA